ncbi:MAG: L-aspartate semialdehyde sulfurtransferase [Thermotogaceae bacterium]|jgi:uncharacterized protein (DUF39 family)|nr:L-aspartate semialdehyde sulfurtransferase [Thermotogaceae bacterium]
MKSIDEINKKIKENKAVVLTASQAKELAEDEGSKSLAEKCDVVTTATYSPMCSSGVFINAGHTNPHMKMQKVFLDDVQAYGGIACADFYLGATQESVSDKTYGGAHVIEKLVKGEIISFKANGTATDCYPKSHFSKEITIEDLNQVYFFNPRNCYQNYNAACNSSERELKTYMGSLLPNLGSVNFAGAGEISPLMNDPYLQTIGIGTRIFFCGGEGFISWEGTQYNAFAKRDEKTHLPVAPSATLAITADLRQVKPEFIAPLYINGYGVSLYISIGIPIPVLNTDIAHALSVRNKDIITQVHDFATGKTIGTLTYEQLHKNNIRLSGKKPVSRTMSKIRDAYKITEILKTQIEAGTFELTQPVKPLPIYGKCTPIE